MKSDLELQRSVLARLKSELGIGADNISASAAGGVLTLNGFVPNCLDRFTAQRIVSHTDGALAWADNIVVKLPKADQRPDTEIANEALRTLRLFSPTATESIKATVENGWVFLAGMVDSLRQKEVAESAIRTLTGVRGVMNFIAVKPMRYTTNEKMPGG